MGIDVNTVCRWVQDYRKKHNLPSYAEEKGIKRRAPQSDAELKARIKLLGRQLKEREVELEAERKKSKSAQEDIEIQKNSCTSLCTPANEVRSDQEVSQGVYRDKDVQGSRVVSAQLL